MDQEASAKREFYDILDEELDEEIAQLTANKTRVTKLFDIPSKPKSDDLPGPQALRPISALGLIRHSRLTRAKYEAAMNTFFERLGVRVLPSFEDIEYAKQFCYPENVKVTPQKAYISLEDLAAHTTMRILEGNQENINYGLKEFTTTRDIIYVEMSMMIYMKDEGESLMGVYISPIKLEYKGNNQEGNNVAFKQTILWESANFEIEQSGRPHQLEFTRLSKDYVVDIIREVEVNTQKLSNDIHCFKFEDKMSMDVSYSFIMADSITDLLADDVVFSYGSMNELQSLLFLEGLTRERLEYTDPVVLASRQRAKRKKAESAEKYDYDDDDQEVYCFV